jgi:Carboxypeptidase regulatory-like domain
LASDEASGVALSGVTVEERSADWKTVLRSTETDAKGRFRFSANPNQVSYYLEFSRSGFNGLRIKLQLDNKAKSGVVLKMPIGT